MPVGLDWYAVPMSSVREVVSRPLLTHVPTAPDAVLGLFNLRGEIVPLFDTAALLGTGHVEEASYCTVVLTPLGPGGLAATGVPEATELGEPSGGAEIPGGVATYALGSRPATLLDIDALLAPARTGGWSQGA